MLRALNYVIAVCLLGIGYHFGAPIKLDDQWGFYEALRTTTSIVFGIMGGLLAIVYPEVIKRGLRGQIINANDNNLHRITDPLAHSALLLIVLVAIAPFFAWLKTLTELQLTDLRVNQISFAILCVLSFWQIKIVQMVLFPLDTLTAQSDDEIARANLRSGIHRNGP
jgi:hypothetical protein